MQASVASISKLCTAWTVVYQLLLKKLTILLFHVQRYIHTPHNTTAHVHFIYEDDDEDVIGSAWLFSMRSMMVTIEHEKKKNTPRTRSIHVPDREFVWAICMRVCVAVE